jgi:hypothetical protein
MKEATSLRDILRAGDPALGEELDAADAARLRARLDTALDETDRRGAFWPGRVLWAGLALTALALVLAVRAPQSPALEGAPPAMAQNVKDQQLQFETSDGVRIVWVLSPNVHL